MTYNADQLGAGSTEKKTTVKISFGKCEKVFLSCHLAFKQIKRLLPALVHADRHGVSLL